MPFKYKVGDDVVVRDVPSVRNDIRLKPFIGKKVKITSIEDGVKFPYYLRGLFEFSANELEAAPAKKKKKSKKKGK